MRSGERSIGWFQKRFERAIGTPAHARRLARSFRVGGAALIILCFAVYIPGLWTIPPVDRDESRFAQASRQMLESGTLDGWVVPRVQDKPRLNKPPLIYWLQASSAYILGDKPGQWAWLDGGSENIWVYRVPSVLSAILAVLLTWRLGVRMFDPRAAWLAAALLAVCPMVVWDAHQARADQLLLAMTTATMLCLWKVWRQSEPNRASGRSSSEQFVTDAPQVTQRKQELLPPAFDRAEVNTEEGTKTTRHQGINSSSLSLIPRSLDPSIPLFWLFLSLGIMTKGPITPMIAGLAVLSLCLVSRDWSLIRRLRPLLGLFIVHAVVAPWVVLVGNAVGWSNYLSIVYVETIGRSAGAKEGHWGPPGYHIVLLGVLFWPGSLLTVAAIGRAWRRGLRSQASSIVLFPASQPEGLKVSSRGWSESASDTPGKIHPTPLFAPRRGDTEVDRSTEPTRELNAKEAKAAEDAKQIRRGVFSSLRGSVSSSLRRFYHSRPGRGAELFCLAWMLPAWIVFELIGTKLPHYTMPMYPAVALMSARMVLGIKPALRSGLNLGSMAWVIFGCFFLIGLPIALILGGVKLLPDKTVLNFIDASFAPALIGLLSLGVYVILVRAILHRRGPLIAIVSASLVWVIVAALVFGKLMPSANLLWNSRRAWEGVRKLDPEGRRAVYSYDYKEDSLVFLSRGRFTMASSLDDAFRRVCGAGTSLILSDRSDFWKLAIDVSAQCNVRPGEHELEIGRGLNYSTGRTVHLYIYSARTDQP